MRVARWGLISIVVAAAWACSDFSEDAPPPSQDGGVVEASSSSSGAVDATGGEDQVSPARGDADATRAYRFVFVSKGTHDPAFGALDSDGGLLGADAFCANEALAGGLKGLRWRAWLGTRTVDPRGRISQGDVVTADYRLITGEVVFPAGFNFKGGATPLHNIDRDQLGSPLLEAEVWTGAYPDGKSFPAVDVGHCREWTSNAGPSDFGMTGFTTRGDAAPTAEWTSATAGPDRDCDTATFHHLYCFEVDE